MLMILPKSLYPYETVHDSDRYNAITMRMKGVLTLSSPVLKRQGLQPKSDTLGYLTSCPVHETDPEQPAENLSQSLFTTTSSDS